MVIVIKSLVGSKMISGKVIAQISPRLFMFVFHATVKVLTWLLIANYTTLLSSSEVMLENMTY